MTLTSEKTHLGTERLAPHLRLTTEPAAAVTSVIQGDRYRFTVLTSRMIRMEYSEDGSFEDRAQLVVCPITSPQNTSLNLGKTKAWLPEGIWIDFMTGMIYRGDRTMYLYRRPEHIPALAPAGAIIPLTQKSEAGNGTANPSGLELRIFAGASGTFELIEDDETELASSQEPARTGMQLNWGAGTFTITPATGTTAAIPAVRNYELSFTGFANPGHITVTSAERPMKYTLTANHATNTTRVCVENVAAGDGLSVTFEDGMDLAQNDAPSRALELLTEAQIDFSLKDTIYKKIQECPDPALLISHLQSLDLEPDLMGAMTEIFLAKPAT